MPALRNQPPPAARPLTSYQRAPSRAESSSRPAIPVRPKTPVDRLGAESRLGQGPKPPVPFLPAGTSHSQSHHISIKNTRNLRRPNSSDSNEQSAPNNRPISRLSNFGRPSTPTGNRTGNRRDLAPESLAREAASKRHLTKPTRRRAFGDGSELEVFDDLPTSASVESKFVKQPIGRGAPKSTFRSKLGQSQIPPPSRTETPLPQTPLSPVKHEATPRFARDTNASRIAREQRMGVTNMHPLREIHPAREGSSTNVHPPRGEGGPLAPLSTSWKAQIAAKGLASPSVSRVKRGKGNRPPQKPCLIKPLGDSVNNAKSVKGMHWNPSLYRWEGNENALVPFDAPIPDSMSPKSSPNAKPAPALITNISAAPGVQIVGTMVFDPERMLWLKMAGSGTASNPMSPHSVSVDEEEDPFADIKDLDDGKERKVIGETALGAASEDKEKGGLGGDEWLVGEEFDVGPEFVRRQRAEEEKWKRKVEGWVGERNRQGDDWKWAIRGIVST